jgi:uncharacterized membrane protein
MPDATIMKSRSHRTEIKMKHRVNQNQKVHRSSAMNAMLLGAGIGAGLMYFFDPDRGARRRALACDQLTHASRVANDAMDVTTRDLNQRAAGLAVRAARWFERHEISDEVLAGRVRSKLGRVVSHPHAISVNVSNGEIDLTGPVLAHEAHRLLSQVRRIRGVKALHDHLSVYQEAGNIPALQGGRERAERFELAQVNWSPAARFVTSMAGGVLFLRGLKRRNPINRGLGLLGLGLLARGISNRDLASLVGMGEASRPITVFKTIAIQAPVERVFDFWSDYRNFPRFMRHVREVRVGADDRSQWVVDGPVGSTVEWTAEITELRPRERVCWRTLPGSSVQHRGAVKFEGDGAAGTRVTIELYYMPSGGALAHFVAKLFGADPKSRMDADLMRIKSAIETGHAPHDAAANRLSRIA